MCFDFLFNQQVPTSTATKVVMGPSAGTFITGIAKQYKDEYPWQLEGHITRRDWDTMMEMVNDMLFTYFPCPLCWCIGYLFCLPTLGLSLCMPAICVRDAETNLKAIITRFNRQKLEQKGIHFSLRKKCGTSWLQLDLPERHESLV